MAAFRRQGCRRTKIGRVAPAARLSCSVPIPQRMVGSPTGRRAGLGGDAGATAARRDLHVAARSDRSKTIGGILDGSCLGVEVSCRHDAAATIFRMIHRRFEAARTHIVFQAAESANRRRVRSVPATAAGAEAFRGAAVDLALRGCRRRSHRSEAGRQRLRADRCCSPRSTALKPLLPMSSPSVTDIPHRAR